MTLYCPLCGCPARPGGCNPVEDLTFTTAAMIDALQFKAKLRCHNAACPVPPPYFKPLGERIGRVFGATNA